MWHVVSAVRNRRVPCIQEFLDRRGTYLLACPKGMRYREFVEWCLVLARRHTSAHNSSWNFFSYKTVPQTDTNTETGGCMYGEGLLMMSAWRSKRVELYTYRQKIKIYHKLHLLVYLLEFLEYFWPSFRKHCSYRRIFNYGVSKALFNFFLLVLTEMDIPVLKCWIKRIIFYISAKIYVMIH
jgi:hypothetical protein